MFHTTTTKITLIALCATGILAAFPEPFDMHSTIHELVEEKMQERTKYDPDVFLKDAIKNDLPDTSSSKDTESCSIDVDRSSDTDCR